MQEKKMESSDNETLYDILIKKGKKEQAEKIPEKYRTVVTKGWYIKLLNDEIEMPEDFEPHAKEIYALWVKESPSESGIYFPWPKNEIEPRLNQGKNVGGGAW